MTGNRDRDERVLTGQTAFVTGGSGGIGGACAEILVRDGAAALLMGRRLDALERTRDGILARYPEARVEVHAGDALDEAEVRAALAAAHAISDRLDIVIPTVGGGAIRPLLMHDAASFREDLELNIMSAFIAVRYAVPLLVESGGGSIVCISSDAAKLPFPWLAAYSTAKNGLEGFVRSAAEELARYGIRVNAVRPGMTRTEATSTLFASPEVRRRFAEEKPLGRLGEPEDIAPGVRYLAGPESSWVTGQSFAIEGGNELRKAPDLCDMVAAIYGQDAFDAVLAGRAPVEDE
jgi:NAD(P)-dependent dehydrogenase (short-subunit alcohol dehydrogenase family)